MVQPITKKLRKLMTANLTNHMLKANKPLNHRPNYQCDKTKNQDDECKKTSPHNTTS